MATKKKEQMTDYTQLSPAELTTKSEKAREDLFKARFRMASATTKDTMQIRGLRREIARLQTFINQRRQNG